MASINQSFIKIIIIIIISINAKEFNARFSYLPQEGA